jgi:hypothetical protein
MMNKRCTVLALIKRPVNGNSNYARGKQRFIFAMLSNAVFLLLEE